MSYRTKTEYAVLIPIDEPDEEGVYVRKIHYFAKEEDARKFALERTDAEDLPIVEHHIRQVTFDELGK